MPSPVTLEKALLRELDANFDQVINPDKSVEVQFNPETLKVSFANQVASSNKPGDQKGPGALQFVGAGTTKLALQLWFDVTAPGAGSADDVRKLTERVAYFITPRKDTKDPNKLLPPAVQFLWGTFKFDGVVDALEESLEFFSPEGRPLRASVSLTLTQQKITKFAFGEAGASTPPGAAGPGGGPAGTQPLAQAPAGASLQGMAASRGVGDNWQAIAAAEGNENPRWTATGRIDSVGV